jgi:hypothetical protein
MPFSFLMQLMQIAAGILQYSCRYRAHRNRRLRKHNPGGSEALVLCMNIINFE